MIDCNLIALDAPPADRQHQQKKRPVRSKKKQGSPEVAATLSGDEGSDSADEYHDALPGQSVISQGWLGFGGVYKAVL